VYQALGETHGIPKLYFKGSAADFYIMVRRAPRAARPPPRSPHSAAPSVGLRRAPPSATAVRPACPCVRSTGAALGPAC